MELRAYQQECIDTIEAQEPGAYLVQMATGLGKTVTFANLPRHGGRMLILSHREELVEQPRKYFACSYGVERTEHHSRGEEVVSASVQSLARRLDRFRPDAFDLVICDEAHHAAARTYRAVFDYFRPEKLIGFTATPNRGDKVRLDTVFQDIIFQRDLRWGIRNGYLCDIHCRRVDIGFDLSAVHTRRGDYAPGELEEAMEGTADAIAQAYREMAVGATLIFAVSVRQAREIAGKIPGAVVVTGETRDRAAIQRGYDFLTSPLVDCDWIITNPPFRLAEQFIRQCAKHKKPFALLLKSQFWNAEKRYKLFLEITPTRVLPLTWRPDFTGKGQAMMDMSWCVWDLEQRGATYFLPLGKPNAEEMEMLDEH